MSQPMSNGDDGDRPYSVTNRSIYELLTEIDKRYGLEFAAVRASIGAADKRYEQRFLAQEKAVDSALIEREKAVIKAEIAAEKRFDALADTFTEKIDNLAVSRDTGIGKGIGYREVFAYVIAIGSLVFWAYLAHK